MPLAAVCYVVNALFVCVRAQIRRVSLLCQPVDEATRVRVLSNGPVDAEAVLRHLRPAVGESQPAHVCADQEAADRERNVPVSVVSGA